MSKITVQIPDYISINQLQKMQDLVGDTPTMRMLEQINIVTGVDIDEIKTWPLDLVSEVKNEVDGLINSYSPEFYPVFEFNGKLWGYNQLSKMDLAAYIDIDNLSKDTMLNLDEVIAIIFRPITSHKLNSVSFKLKNTWKSIAHNSSEPVFDYYTLEAYDNFKRKDYSQEVKDFPAELVMGGLLFFLMSGSHYLKATQISSQPLVESGEMQMMMMLETLTSPLLNTTVGSSPYTNLRKLPSYQLGDKRVC
jgi:hypothetical protein